MVKLREAMSYGNEEVFHPYEGFEADIGFWYGEYCRDVDAGLNNPDVGIAEYIAEKIDEEHPTESPEQFKSLVRLVREIYPKSEKKWSVNIHEASEQPFVFIKIFDPYEDGEARATVQSYGGPMAYNVWSISKENIQDIKDELPDWENRIAFYRYYSNGKLGGKLSEAQISGHALAGKNVGKRIREAQANLAYYGFRRVPEEDFSDDGTRFFMYVWDPENTGKSPFYFSKAGGYGMVFFSEHIYYIYNNADELRKAIRAHGYHLDDLNGINKEHFTDEALGKIVAQLQEIRESSWFEDICPEFSTRGAIDRGIEVKDYNADKDHQRVMDIAKRANSDPEKMAKLAANMAKAIGDKEKMRSRWQAAVDVYGSESPVAKAFEAQVKDRGWSINIRPRSGDIDWSSLFESINDKSIYDAHAEYKKDQLKKKEEEDNQENFTFDEGSVKLATVVKESAERKYWNNFFDKITESVDSDRIETLLKNYFDTDDVSLSDETCWGLPVYIVDNKRYAVGDSDDVYDAAVQQAIDVFEDDTDEGKIRWLQKNNWPGVDEESVCNDLGDNPDDYEEESIYKPSSIDEYIDTMGYTDAAEAFSMAFIGNYLDKRELGEYIVDSDGVAPLASEDGREISIGDDLSAFCLGGAY